MVKGERLNHLLTISFLRSTRGVLGFQHRMESKNLHTYSNVDYWHKR